MTEQLSKRITSKRIATFKAEQDDGSFEEVNVARLRIDGASAPDETYVAASLPSTVGKGPATAAHFTLRTFEGGTREIITSDQVGKEKALLSSRTLAMLAEAAFHNDVLHGINYGVKVTVPRTSEVTRLYYETLGMRPTFIGENDQEVTLRGDAKSVRGFAAEALRVNATRRLRDSALSPKQKTAWDEEAA